MSNYKIVLLPGDGIGPEVMEEAVSLLEALAQATGFGVEFEEQAAGGAAIDKHNHPLPDEVLERCLAADAVEITAGPGLSRAL